MNTADPNNKNRFPLHAICEMFRSPGAVTGDSVIGRATAALFITIFIITLMYRILLTLDLMHEPVKPFDFNPDGQTLLFITQYVPTDCLFLLCLTLISWMASRLFRKNFVRAASPVGILFILITVFITILIYETHSRLLFVAQTGLSAAVIRELSTNVSFAGIIPYIEIDDYIMLAAPLILFLLLLRSDTLRRWTGRITAATLLLFILLVPAGLLSDEKPLAPEIRRNPVIFLLGDIASQQFSAKQELSALPEVAPCGMQLISEKYVKNITPVKLIPPHQHRRWNVVFLIMESVGERYIFNTGSGVTPMPFLRDLSKRGWYLSQHYTTSNISSRAVFSLLSGLYDFFHKETFSTRPDAATPSLYSFLGKEYDGFLVTPSSIYWYFPTAFLKNSTIQMFHFENLPFKVQEAYRPAGHYIARDERDTMNFFLERLTTAREPFLGIYISFVAHYPYFDYGARYHIAPPSGRLIDLYYNNLYLLDRLIERLYTHLKEQKLLDRTILVIVGDHGQAFGQHHPNNFMHFRYSYDENLHAPAVFYQPALFTPKVIDSPTSHVDILPTVLDAMRIPYDPLLLQGESLFHSSLSRRYIFFYGQEETISSMSSEKIKVLYSLRENRCWAFDLKSDPAEEQPLNCKPYAEQLESLRAFVHFHNRILPKYNASIREKRDFYHRRHPPVR